MSRLMPLAPKVDEPLGDGAILSVRQLTVDFTNGLTRTRVVEELDVTLRKNRTVALVGESGSGKTTAARAIMGLVAPPTGEATGSVIYDGRNLLEMSRQELAKIRGRDIAMIFQEPMRSLNPAFTVGDQIAEVVRTHKKDISRGDAWKQAVDAMDHVRIPNAERLARRYPFEFSGGMCQRVMIAMAIVCRPTVLIADEPTTALDVTVQAQVLDLLKDLQDEMGLAMLFITHDLGVVADVADDVRVMYAGQVVESGLADRVFFSPEHPYTEGLLASIPSVLDDQGRFRFIPGRVPSATEWPTGCRFRARCEYALVECAEEIPIYRTAQGESRCIRVGEVALRGMAEA